MALKSVTIYGQQDTFLKELLRYIRFKLIFTLNLLKKVNGMDLVVILTTQQNNLGNKEDLITLLTTTFQNSEKDIKNIFKFMERTMTKD